MARPLILSFVPYLNVLRQAMKKGPRRTVSQRTLMYEVRVPSASKSKLVFVMFYLGSIPISFMAIRMV